MSFRNQKKLPDSISTITKVPRNSIHIQIALNLPKYLLVFELHCRACPQSSYPSGRIMNEISTARKWTDWITLRHLTADLPREEARSVRMTNAIQLTFFIMVNLLLPQVIFNEPPETHFTSSILFTQITLFSIVARILLYLRWFVLGAVLTLLGLNIHIFGLCIAYADDPAHILFFIFVLLPFIVIPTKYLWLRWMFVITTSAGFLADQLYFRSFGGVALFGPPKWTGPVDYFLPPLFLGIVFFILIVRTFVKAIRNAEVDLEFQHAASEKLLMNILPEEIAKELKSSGKSVPRHYKSATICFTDFVGFTQISESMSPADLVGELDRCFSFFDGLMNRNNLEKLKTIGDSYMFAGGIPVENKTHAVDCIMAALEIQAFMNQMKDIKQAQGLPYWELRLGIHSGELVAGVIGEQKFAYDVWSDTVNTASRCESSGIPGKINISKATYELVKDFFDCEYRGSIPAKNKGNLDMYFVTGIRAELQKENQPRVPSEKFNQLYQRLAEVVSPP